jgi:hypothetical protein
MTDVLNPGFPRVLSGHLPFSCDKTSCPALSRFVVYTLLYQYPPASKAGPLAFRNLLRKLRKPLYDIAPLTQDNRALCF